MAALGLAHATAIATPAVLERVELGPDGTTVVQLQLSAPAQPVTRVLAAEGDRPERLVVDLADVVLGQGAARMLAGARSGPLLRVRTGQFTATTARVVLDLAGRTPAIVHQRGPTVTIALVPGEPPRLIPPRESPPGEPALHGAPSPIVASAPPRRDAAPQPMAPPRSPAPPPMASPTVATASAVRPAAPLPLPAAPLTGRDAATMLVRAGAPPPPVPPDAPPMVWPPPSPWVVDVGADVYAALACAALPVTVARAEPPPPPPAPWLPDVDADVYAAYACAALPVTVARAEPPPPPPALLVADVGPEVAADVASPALPVTLARTTPPAPLPLPAVRPAPALPPAPRPALAARPRAPAGAPAADPATRWPLGFVAPTRRPGAPATIPHAMVVVDAGHGGRDPGAAGLDGLQEKDVALVVAASLAAKLAERLPVTAVLTRWDDSFVPLGERLPAPDGRPTVFVSLHANASRDHRPHGVEVFFGGDLLVSAGSNAPSPRAQRLGRSIAQALAAHGARVRGQPRPGRFAVLRRNPAPGVLIEVGYLTHPEDAAALRDPARLDALTDALCEGVARFLQAGV